MSNEGKDSRPKTGDKQENEAPAPTIVEQLSNNTRTVVAFIRDKSYTINIADGSQTVDWLADVVLFKYKRSQFEKMNCRGVKYHNKLLDMQSPIALQVENGQEVYILLEGDEDVDQMFGDEI
ncbi:hypothetical protein TVAG_433180 [Trichomonas vaginalis G3]|uniref:Rad60/SUMO-like domain-containing protein n=1 Tax=Trichomonas vaginalis (strain ATCC PRA-98 / G3) TaxID=412133 RepID=A2DIV9_TRIV3|nr:hypothetical protein TVAGG3_0561910 [Trichomonas vaginalis G3]EAY19722.1 hypothetical protein TVAG_433180 [Trichomonas vaginalis G3]KAI5521258.1 hypothetical protein TVAGG3_0561910 [Trichomonas vaginalis G3]|eukprot:XP_001580708.1 hypothetical protein [Trichomonas vaginalis G3]